MNVLLDAEGQVRLSAIPCVAGAPQLAISNTWQVRLSDMGLAADISRGPIKQCCGTRGYWAPEMILREPYTTEPDWWSLGVTLVS